MWQYEMGICGMDDKRYIDNVKQSSVSYIMQCSPRKIVWYEDWKIMISKSELFRLNYQMSLKHQNKEMCALHLLIALSYILFAFFIQQHWNIGKYLKLPETEK